MINDTERRKAAAKMRAMDAERIDSEYGGTSSLSTITLGYIADAVGLHYAPYEFTSTELRDRLADLIEPSEPKVKCVAEVKVDGERLEKLAHDAAVELTGIDRDALLALADEIWENADISRELHGEMLKEKRLDMALTFHEYALELREYADRIREALGVES